MMHRFPIAARKRHIIEMSIRILDSISYAAVFLGGIYALFFTPTTITSQLTDWEWLIPIWAAFLMVGGFLGFVGRITTVWMFEPPATVASTVGILIYFVVLGNTAFTTITSAVATCLVFMAFLSVTRRYLELQLFGSDPASRKFQARLKVAFQRRIPNVTTRG